MIAERWKIYWTEYATNAYIYGSDISFIDRDNVEFINELIPPGTVINRWYSRTNFQAQRIEPTLPMIDGESSYQIASNFECPEGESCHIRLTFYDKYEQVAGFVNVRDKVMDFKCPLKTYYYTMELVSAGATKLNFHYIEIREIVDEEKH